MIVISKDRSTGPRKSEISFISYTKLIALILLMNCFASSAWTQDLDPTVPPGENFDLSYWKLTRPNGTERDEDALINGYYKEGEFYTDTVTGAMVFWCPNFGSTTANTSFPRTELREMIRRGDTSIGTQGINKNNWVFSSSTMENQMAAGGVDGIMTATLTVDHVSETSDEFRKVGRTIVGQIHASDDEPCRLYYRKLPGHERGSIYFAHEPTTSAEQWYDMIGSRSDDQPDPEDGIALGEMWSYEIKVVGNLLTVTIIREGKPDVVQEVDMTNSGFADDWMYYRAGNYNQNNAGDPDEFAQVSFYALDVRHFGPIPPTEFLAPSDIPKFQPFLAECKLQAPTSSTIADRDYLNNGFTHDTYFYVADDDKMLFRQSGEDMRTELRHEENWDLNDRNRSMHGRMDVVEQTCDQVTIMQIHDDANAGNGPNKPLLRVYKHRFRDPGNHLWAAIKTDEGGVNTIHVDLGEDPGGYFNVDVRLVDGFMIIDVDGEEKVNMDVSFWDFPSYWKAGAYLQDSGSATIHFDDLFEGDGSVQNFFPTVSLTSPSSGNFLPGSDITFTADAQDSDGSVTKVEFLRGGNVVIGEATSEPYTFVWENAPEGEYAVTAVATDNLGAERSSLTTNITVRVPVDVTGVALEDIYGPIATGASIQLNADVLPADATNPNLTFTSSDPSIADVSPEGFLTSSTSGDVTITVTSEDGGFVDSKVISVLDPSSEVNRALGRPVEGTGEADGPNVPGNIVDGDTGSRWSVMPFPHSATIDLQDLVRITQTEVTSFQDRAYQFVIEAATDVDGPYTTIVDRTMNRINGFADLPIVNSVDGFEARYVRISVFGADVYTGPWVSLTELRIFGESLVNVSDFNDENVQLSPNPVSSVLSIEGVEAYNVMSVYNVSGSRLIERSINGTEALDVTQLPAGVYYIKLEGDDNLIHVDKFVKQ